MPKLFFSINPCNPQINVNLQLLMVEVEYERVARVCNNVFYEKLTVLLSLDIPKNCENHENTDWPTDLIF